jgi:hypothetical protein
MEYIKYLEKKKKQIGRILEILNKNKVEGNFNIQVDNFKYIKKEDFKITCATTSILYHNITESWRDNIIDIIRDEGHADKEIYWKWILDEKGKKIYNKIAKQNTVD